MSNSPHEFGITAIISTVTAVLAGFWVFINKNAISARNSIDEMRNDINEIEKTAIKLNTTMIDLEKQFNRIETKLDKILDNKLLK